MGCSNSNEKGSSEDSEKAIRFSNRVSKREPLAKALQKSFDDFIRSCEDVSNGRRNSVDYDADVKVNTSVDEANDKNLTYVVAKDTASDFLGYAMEVLGKKNWGGNVHSHLHGAEGRMTKLTMDGKVEFDTANETVEEPYNVAFSFFCALE